MKSFNNFAWSDAVIWMFNIYYRFMNQVLTFGSLCKLTNAPKLFYIVLISVPMNNYCMLQYTKIKLIFLKIWKMSHFCLPFWQYWDWFELHRALVNACFDRLVLFKGDTMGSNPKSRLFLAKSKNLLCRCCCSLLECLLLRLNVLLLRCWKKPGNFLGHS